MKLKKILSMLLAVSVASGSISVPAIPLQVEAAQTTVTVSDDTPKEKKYVYGIMKIPYASFYEAELEGANDIDVDTVTSATASKWKIQDGTYYEAANEGDGGSILGVEYYVAIEEAVYEELVKNKSSLLNDFSKIEEVPAAYKVMDKNGNFSAVQGKTTVLENVKTTFTNNSYWGDYQMNFSGLEIDGTVYGVIVKTSDGAEYGLRHLENIWNNGTQISWSCGVKTTEYRGNALSYEHYASMMGKTITDVTWITENGIYTVNNLEHYVATNHTGTVAVEDGYVKDGKVAVTTENLPEDGQWEAVVPETLAGASYKDGVLSYSTDAMPGSYTLKFVDSTNKYAEVSTSFVLKTEALPVQFAKNGNKVVTAKGSADTDAANFMKNLSTVEVTYGEKTTTYKTNGSCCCCVTFFNEDGTLNLEAAKKGSDVFSKEGKYTLKVNAIGYENSLTFDVDVDYVYGTAQIPYDAYYSAELSANDVAVDAVTSATAAKWQRQAGTYYEAATEGEGGTILGVEAPVAIERSAYEALKAAGNEIIASFTETENCAAAYKRIYQNGSLSAIQGKTTVLENVKTTFTNNSYWGDYQMNFSGLEIDGTVYGVIVKTSDGAEYGLRHLENIWNNGTQISWSCGVKTTEYRGNALSYEHYASMMGKTITDVTWITENGIYTVNNLEHYVATNHTGTISVEDGYVKDGKVAVTTENLPEDGQWEAVVPETLAGASYKDGVLSYSTDAMPGSYTLKFVDSTNKYAEVSTSFVLKTEALPVQFAKNGNKVVTAEGSADTDAANFMKNLSTVEVTYGEKTTTYKTNGSCCCCVTFFNEDGTLNIEAAKKGSDVFSKEGKYTLKVNAIGYENSLTFDVDVDYVYGTVKIPYDAYYSAELSANDVAVDAVTSATASKWQKQAGTYFEAAADGNGGTILGVEAPVAIERSAYEALKAAGNEIIATFTETEGCAAAYKRMYQNGTFSATKGETKELENVTYTFATSSTWGDYQMNFTGLELEGTVYGVVIETTDGAEYGLRHLENIWKKGAELSWSSGIKTVEAKGNALSYEHYASLMGKTISKVTWITEAGMYTVSNLEQYVPVKYNGTITIPDTKVSEGKVTVTTAGFPEDGNWNVTVPETLSGASYKDGVLSFDASAMPGSYTLTFTDASNKYAETSASFVLTTEKLPVQFKDNKLVAADGSTEAEATNYIKNISAVTVKFGEASNAYKTSGKGSVAIIKEDGTIDEAAASRGTAVFAEAGTYELTVEAAGYNSLTFTYTVEAKAEITSTPTPTKSEVNPAVNPTTKPTAAPTSKPTATPTQKPKKVTAPKKVKLSKASNVKGKKLKVTWKKVSGAAGYQIVIATNKKFTSGKKTITVKSGKTTTKTISKLKKKKTYYVKVRAYKNSDGKKVWGTYSNVKKVKIKK